MSERFTEQSLRLCLLGCLAVLGCAAAEDDPLRILEAQRPLVTDQVSVTKVRSDDGPTDHVRLPPGGRQMIELDIQGGEWGLGKQFTVTDGTTSSRSKPVPPSPKDRMLFFQGIVYSADGPHRTKEVQQVPIGFRFNEQGTGGILQASLIAPKKPGRYALEVRAINTEEVPEPPPTEPDEAPDWVAPLWRTSLTVVAKD